MEEIYKTIDIGPILQTERKRQCLSMREMGRRMGVSHAHVSKIEAGKVNVSLKVLQDYANALKMNLVDIFFEARLNAIPTQSAQLRLARKFRELVAEMDKIESKVMRNRVAKRNQGGDSAIDPGVGIRA